MERFLCYEDFFKKEGTEESVDKEILFLQYAILFRRWDKLNLDCLNLRLKEYAYIPEVDTSSKQIVWKKSDKTIENLLNYNFGYFNKHFDKNRNSELNHHEGIELGYYSEIIEEERNLYDIFFCGQFPMLNVIKYDCQMRASRKLKETPYHLIFDEVGTGKTVSALYCIRDVLLEKGMNARILVVCPNNKINEWKKDIQRQLGLYAHSVEYGNNNIVYKDEMKKVYFNENEAQIFIEGQKKEEINDSLYSWSSSQKWDIVIIDEGHLCFDNYNDFSCEKMVILTATPIVINSSSKEGKLTIDKVRGISEYIELARKCTGSTHQGEEVVNDLFSKQQDYITQLFREDLDINPKSRKIRFEYTERWSDRKDYLEVLRETVGGMARLVYEQDDEFLLYGVYDKFRKEIEKCGYSLGAERPKIPTNEKYEKVKDIIFRPENKGKSYIVFFNSKWPAENIYNKFINDTSINKTRTIFAIKFGKSVCRIWPKDANVNSENIYDYLLGKIDSGWKVVFLTTGATGGTGLNLGKFNGIINYEIPFTSIELEQRFGRVDRMDDDDDDQTREMYFILNNDSNPMLRYGVIKINATSLFMPIRNTILFCPDYIKANFKSLETELNACILNDDEKNIYATYQEKRKLISKKEETDIVDDLLSCIMKTKSYKSCEQDISGISEACDELIQYIDDNIDSVFECKKKKKNIEYLGREVNNWLELLGIEPSNTSYEIGSAILTDEDADEDVSEEKISEEITRGNLLIVEEKQEHCDKITDAEELIKLIADAEVDTQEGSGIFYYNDGYHRETVEEFRKKCGL